MSRALEQGRDMTESKLVAILVLVLLVGSPTAAYSGSFWGAFLARPDKNALVALEKSIIASRQLCELDRASPQEHRTQLFRLVREGNEWAFRAALLVSKCWDGGESEDVDRSAGVLFEAQPRVFFQIMKEKAVADLQLRFLLTRLPLDTADDIG